MLPVATFQQTFGCGNPFASQLTTADRPTMAYVSFGSTTHRRETGINYWSHFYAKLLLIFLNFVYINIRMTSVKRLFILHWAFHSETLFTCLWTVQLHYRRYFSVYLYCYIYVTKCFVINIFFLIFIFSGHQPHLNIHMAPIVFKSNPISHTECKVAEQLGNPQNNYIFQFYLIKGSKG